MPNDGRCDEVIMSDCKYVLLYRRAYSIEESCAVQMIPQHLAPLELKQYFRQAALCFLVHILFSFLTAHYVKSNTLAAVIPHNSASALPLTVQSLRKHHACVIGLLTQLNKKVSFSGLRNPDSCAKKNIFTN